MKHVRVAFLCALVGAVASYGTSGWREYGSAPTNKDIFAVRLVTPASGWAVGYWGEVLRYDGTRWYTYLTWPVEFLQDVDFGAPNFGFAVGARGVAIRWDGTRWHENSVPTSANLYAVGVPPGQTSVAWAAGAGGEVWRWSGGVWTRENVNITRDIHDFHWSSAEDGWLCGNYGTVYHYYDGAWHAVNAWTSTNFYCIYALSPYNVWVGGDAGRLYHYEGFQWALTYTPVNAAIREMAFTSPIDGWAVCDDGYVIHYDGYNWTRAIINPPTTRSFCGLAMLSAEVGWAVGKTGMMYYYTPNVNVTGTSLGRVKALYR